MGHTPYPFPQALGKKLTWFTDDFLQASNPAEGVCLRFTPFHSSVVFGMGMMAKLQALLQQGQNLVAFAATDRNLAAVLHADEVVPTFTPHSIDKVCVDDM